jgi:hypothetical protein
MAQPKPQKLKQPQNKVPTEPGFEGRLSDMYKKVLHTPPPRKRDTKPASRPTAKKP